MTTPAEASIQAVDVNNGLLPWALINEKNLQVYRGSESSITDDVPRIRADRFTQPHLEEEYDRNNPYMSIQMVPGSFLDAKNRPIVAACLVNAYGDVPPDFQVFESREAWAERQNAMAWDTHRKANDLLWGVLQKEKAPHGAEFALVSTGDQEFGMQYRIRFLGHSPQGDLFDESTYVEGSRESPPVSSRHLCDMPERIRDIASSPVAFGGSIMWPNIRIDPENQRILQMDTAVTIAPYGSLGGPSSPQLRWGIKKTLAHGVEIYQGMANTAVQGPRSPIKRLGSERRRFYEATDWNGFDSIPAIADQLWIEIGKGPKGSARYESTDEHQAMECVDIQGDRDIVLAEPAPFRETLEELSNRLY